MNTPLSPVDGESTKSEKHTVSVFVQPRHATNNPCITEHDADLFVFASIMDQVIGTNDF